QREEGGAALVDDGSDAQARLLRAGERQRRGAGAGAHRRLGSAGGAELVDQRPRPERVEVRGRLHGAPRASSSARALSCVSTHSSSAEEPSTMPAPTNSLAVPLLSRAQRSATASSA